jgi:Putative beta barrel porin-7 (BBP7)
MLGRLHICLLLACMTLTAGVAHAQYQPPPARGVAYQPGPTYFQDPTSIDPSLIQELLPADRGLDWDTEPLLDRALDGSIHGAFVRLEYLNTYIDNPGRGLLGAPIAGVADPRQPFLVSTPSGSIIEARVMDVSSVDLKNINGIRATVGVPLQFGSIEGLVWGTQQHTDTIIAQDIPNNNPLNPVNAVATSLLTDGAPGPLVVLHDQGFFAPYSAKIFGAEANLYYNYQNPRLGLRVLPVIGFRFNDYDESLYQRGLFSNTSDAALGSGMIDPPLVRHINSTVDNNLYAGQVGARVEFAHQWVTLGVEPKVGVGINHYDATVQTVDLRDSPFPPVVDDGVTTSHLRKDNAATTFDLRTYATVHLNNWFNVRVGWTFVWLGGVARANNVIYYNDLGTSVPPAVGTRSNPSNLWGSSFTIGGEVVLP